MKSGLMKIIHPVVIKSGEENSKYLKQKQKRKLDMKKKKNQNLEKQRKGRSKKKRSNSLSPSEDRLFERNGEETSIK